MTCAESYVNSAPTHRRLKGVMTHGRDDARSTDAGSGPHVITRARLLEMLGGRRGIVAGGLPPLVFALVNAVAGAITTRSTALGWAIAAAAAAGLVIVVLRLVRKEGLRQPLVGLAGLAIAIAFALQSGEARGFFLPGIYFDAAYGIAFLASAIAGRPLVGVIYGLLTGRRRQWRGDDRLRRYLTIATVAWAVVCGLRAGVQAVLYLNDQPSLLAAAKLALDWPLTIGAVLLTLALIRRGTSGRTPHESHGHPRK